LLIRNKEQTKETLKVPIKKEKLLTKENDHKLLTKETIQPVNKEKLLVTKEKELLTNDQITKETVQLVHKEKNIKK